MARRRFDWARHLIRGRFFGFPATPAPTWSCALGSPRSRPSALPPSRAALPRRLAGGDFDSSSSEFRTGLDGWRSSPAFSLKRAHRRFWPLHLFSRVRMMFPSQVPWISCTDWTTDVEHEPQLHQPGRIGAHRRPGRSPQIVGSTEIQDAIDGPRPGLSFDEVMADVDAEIDRPSASPPPIALGPNGLSIPVLRVENDGRHVLRSVRFPGGGLPALIPRGNKNPMSARRDLAAAEVSRWSCASPVNQGWA